MSDITLTGIRLQTKFFQQHSMNMNVVLRTQMLIEEKKFKIDVTFVDEGVLLLTYARHIWQLSSEGSIACHTLCDKSDNKGHLRRTVTLTHFAERLAV